MFEKKKGLHLCLRLRTKKTTGEASVYCRLRYDGQYTSEYALNMYVPVEAWDQQLKALRPEHPLADPFLMRLAEVKAEHESVLLYQNTQQASFTPTAHTIKNQWRRKPAGGVSSVQVRVVYGEYLDYLKALPPDERKSAKTLSTYAQVQTHLSKFLLSTGQTKLLADEVTPGWGKRFYDYLRQKVARDSATRYLLAVRSALNHALLYDRINTNGLYEFKAPQAQARKPIFFLNKDQLNALTHLPLVGIRKQVRDWAVFMCHTGLDYNDATEVVKNPEKYLAGDKWVYQRLKLKRVAMWGECHIPILNEAAQMLPPLQAQRRKHRLKVVNTYLKEMGQALGLLFEFTSKVCRKTAGAVFMEAGYSMQSIQKILGHQSLSVTEAHYVSIQPSVVDQDTRRIKAALSNQPPFSSLHKAS